MARRGIPGFAYIVEIFDPAARYMRRRSRLRRRGRRGRKPFRGAAVFEYTGGKVSARQATPEEIDEMRAKSTERRRERGAARQRAEERWHDEVWRCAEELIASGETHRSFDGVELTGRLVRFRWPRRADAVLDLAVSGSGPSGGSSLSRLGSQHRTPEIIADYVLRMIASRLA